MIKFIELFLFFFVVEEDHQQTLGAENNVVQDISSVSE